MTAVWLLTVISAIVFGLLSASLLGFEFGAVIALVAVMVYVVGALLGLPGGIDGGD